MISTKKSRNIANSYTGTSPFTLMTFQLLTTTKFENYLFLINERRCIIAQIAKWNNRIQILVLNYSPNIKIYFAQLKVNFLKL